MTKLSDVPCSWPRGTGRIGRCGASGRGRGSEAQGRFRRPIRLATKAGLSRKADRVSVLFNIPSKIMGGEPQSR